MDISEPLKDRLIVYQRNELTEHHIYRRLAQVARSDEDRQDLERIAEDERKHYETWRRYTGRDVPPYRLMFWKYYLASRLFGITFSVRLMERNEATAQENYRRLKGEIPEVDAILKEEHDHEERLVGFFDEEHLRYAGSIVLGLNDALVEMLGALAGLTLALQNSSLIALSALTTGIAAAMSMGASEYLSTKTEENSKHPLKSSFYTGFTYLFIVAILVAPYLLLENYYLSFGITLLLAITAMGLFNYYMAVAKDLSFLKRFGEMAGLSLGVAALSFGVGYFLRVVLKVQL